LLAQFVNLAIRGVLSVATGRRSAEGECQGNDQA